MRRSAALQHIRHLSSLGLPARVAIPAMVDALADLVSARTRNFIWLNAHGMPCDMYEREPIASALNTFFEQMPILVKSHEPSIDKMLRVPVDYGAGLLMMRLPNWENSVMHNEVFRPYGIGYHLDFPIRDGAQARGVLTINREPGSCEFTSHQIEDVLSLRKFFLHAMSAPEVLLEAATASDQVSLVVLAGDGTVLQCEPGASQLFSQLSGQTSNSFRMLTRQDRAPAELQDMANKLAALQSGADAAPPMKDITTRWGRIRIRAHSRDAQGNCYLTVQQLLSKTIHRMTRLAQSDLSPRERRIALAMCSSGAGDDVAQICGVTAASYRQYAKRIYARLEVEGRDGLRQHLDDPLAAAI